MVNYSYFSAEHICIGILLKKTDLSFLWDNLTEADLEVSSLWSTDNIFSKQNQNGLKKKKSQVEISGWGKHQCMENATKKTKVSSKSYAKESTELWQKALSNCNERYCYCAAYNIDGILKCSKNIWEKDVSHAE